MRTIIALLVALLMLTSCGVQRSGNIGVVTSTYPLYEFAKAVGGNRTDVTLLLPKGAEPHSFEPTVNDIVRIRQADLFIFSGPDLEPWAQQIIRSTNVTSLTPEMLFSANVTHDPHYWLSFRFDQSTVDLIRDQLTAMDPAGANIYAENARAYNAKLSTLSNEYEQGLKVCQSREMVIAGHAAFGYLAQDYNLTQVALKGINPEAEPSPAMLIEITRIAKEQGLTTVFHESLVDPRVATNLAGSLGAHLLELNDAAAPNDLDFITIMQNNLRNLREGLGCQ